MYDFMHFAFQNAQNYIFRENLKKIIGFISKLRYDQVTHKRSFFFYLAKGYPYWYGCNTRE